LRFFWKKKKFRRFNGFCGGFKPPKKKTEFFFEQRCLWWF
jgi:hypothetical protein